MIARVPLDEGGLTGTVRPDTEFADDDHRSHYFRGDRPREVYERAPGDRGRPGHQTDDEVPETALRFVLTQPAVSTVIPGMRSVRNVERNVAVSDGGAAEDALESLRAHRWERNFYE